MVVRKAAKADLSLIVDAYRLAFAWDEERSRRYVEMTGLDCFRVLEKNGQSAAVWAVVPCGHWFGGRVVPAANIAHVAIQPEFRGGGLAAEILDLSCEDARRDGAILASLFASTRPVYRRAGFNLAGHEMIYEADTSELYKIRQELRSRRVPLTGARAALEPIYRAASSTECGLLDRHDAHWNAHFDATTSVPSVFVFGEDEGYAVLDTSSPGTIGVRDWTAINGAAARQILRFIGTFSTVFEKTRWHGAPQDALVFAMPDKGWRLVHQEEFLIRVLDPGSALSARGYACADADLTLAIKGDDRVTQRISIKGGRATCAPGANDSEYALTVQSSHFASLFSGFRSASFLRRAGYADGNSETVALADKVFAGPPPWVAEHF
ncbi:putative acetyltransferase [Pararhizobium capsulatum DSM 1112]|uniref:Acetyltransferase n=1 Tax=Pararhizobium capsulatum DSM 1112 TaxID=1121113 RepID=A0ABU0BPV2_9HYPH|nr:GNAT family N-acetyltransferase [Pararhizobium capsulatum]MDQ0320279.1 putative acetyltransferase [Pararhizobium capsulatum DSM 1112]